jgi:murein DD-endopeptidase MepM/ murein hydrolase activator NlpD
VTPIEKAKVKEIGFNTTNGNYIVLQHGDDTDSTFKHLVTGSILAKVGDIVERGLAIATAGKTGNTSGALSHYGIRIKGVFVDPILYLQG